jgi:hypothetical protein
MVSDGPMSRRIFLRRSVSVTAVAATAGAFPGPAAARTRSAAHPTSRLGNIQVSHDGFTMHADPSFAASPRDPRNLIGICSVAQGSQMTLATYASADGGNSWHSNGVLPGVTSGFDMTAAFDAAGHGFVCAMVNGALPPQGPGVRVWRSNDGGRSFLPPAIAIADTADHPSMTADRWDSSSSGRIYVAAALDPGLVFTCSADSGRTFGLPRVIDAQGGFPVIAAGPGGLVSIVYLELVPPASSATIHVVTSTDHGESFRPAAELASISIKPFYNLPAIAAAPDGGLHVALAAYDNATGRSSLWLYSSRDRGGTWGAPALLASSRQAIYLQPTVAVDGHNRVAVQAFADRNNAIDVLLYICDAGRGHVQPPILVTTKPFSPTIPGANERFWIGDYQGIAAIPDAFYPFWNDTRTGRMEIFTAAVPASSHSQHAGRLPRE